MYWNVHTLIPLTSAVAYAGLLVVVLQVRPQTRMHRSFGFYLATMFVWAAISFLAHAGIGPLHIAFRLILVAGLVAAFAMFRFVLIFFDRRSVVYGPMMVATTFAAGFILFSEQVVGDVSVNAGVLTYEFRPGMAVLVLIAIPVTLLTFIELRRGHRRATYEEERNRIRYLFAGQAIVLATLPVNFTPLGSYPVDIAANTINALLIVYAIVRYELLDITRVARQGLSRILLTATLTGSYLVPVVLFELVVHGRLVPLGSIKTSVVLIAAAAMAISIPPLYGIIKERVDHLFFQQRRDELQMVQELSHSVTTTLSLQTLADMLVDRVIAALRATSVILLLRDTIGDGFVVSASRGLHEDALNWRSDHPIARWLTREETVLTRRAVHADPFFRGLWAEEREQLVVHNAELFVPLQTKEGLLGILVVGIRQSGKQYTPEERSLLSTLANQVAMAVENARLYEKTRRMAIMDGLTRLYNSRYFYTALAQELERSRRYGHHCSLMMVDVDNFKRYNDRYGHLTGDDVLRTLAELITKTTRQADVAARYGGEEFMVILPETPLENAVALAERLRRRVRSEVFVVRDGRSVGHITVSIGVATYPDGAQTREGLIQAADMALLEAKAEGKDRVCVVHQTGAPALSRE